MYMHWHVLWFLERYYSTYKKFPSFKVIMETFELSQKKNVTQMIDILIERGYLKKDPTHISGERRSNLMFTKKRFDFNLFNDRKQLKQFDDQFITIDQLKKSKPEPTVSDIGTTYVGNS